MALKPKLTVIVCTYNRGSIIKETLPTLFDQDVNKEDFNVIIVNNNSNDDTSKILQAYQDKYQNLNVIEEENQGLSHAKNVGMIAAKTDWIIYLDDDAKVPVDFIRKAINNINTSEFSCFGGVYLPWYKYGKPKWYKAEYASNKDKLAEFGKLEKDFISGGIMAIKKNLLLKYGGFSTEIGMKGNKIAYGEENLFQIILREKGFEIGYDPNWIIYHLVGKYKLSPFWFIKRGFYSGKGYWITYQEIPSSKKIIKIFFRSFKLIINDIIKYSPKLLNKNYYIQNWLINVFSPFSISIGQVYGGMQFMTNKNDQISNA